MNLWRRLTERFYQRERVIFDEDSRSLDLARRRQQELRDRTERIEAEVRAVQRRGRRR